MKGKKQAPKGHLFEGWAFTRTNYILFALGVAFIILGYLVMASGTVNSFRSLTLAPIMLVVGYVVLIPAALIYRAKGT